MYLKIYIDNDGETEYVFTPKEIHDKINECFTLEYGPPDLAEDEDFSDISENDDFYLTDPIILINYGDVKLYKRSDIKNVDSELADYIDSKIRKSEFRIDNCINKNEIESLVNKLNH